MQVAASRKLMDDDEEDDYRPYQPSPSEVVAQAPKEEYKPPQAAMQESEVYKTAYETQYNPAPTSTAASSKLRFDDDDGEQYEYKPAAAEASS